MAARNKPAWVKPSDMRQPPEIIPDDAELRDVELFDEDGDIADDDQCFDPEMVDDLDEEDRDPEGEAILYGESEEKV